MVANMTLSISQAGPLLNWTRVLEYDRNITKHHTDIHSDDDDDNDDNDDVTSIVIVGVGIVMIIFMLILQKWSKEDRSERYAIA